MKKITFTILSAICLSILAPGCKKLLEVKPQSSITDAVFFKSENDFEPYVTGIYTSMRSLSNDIVYGTERSEELVSALNSRFGVSWSQIITPASGAVNYNNWYKAIGNCNLLLSKIEAFPFTSNPDLKKRILGETYSLRAYFYFHLTRIIGDAPLMLQAIVDENVPQLPRAKATDVMKQIQADLDLAIQNFTSMSQFSKTAYPSKYRFAYGSAMALKADAHLWSAKVLAGGNTDFTAAVAAITEVEATGLILNTDYKNVTGVRVAANPEIALAAYFQRDEANNNYGINALPYLPGIQGALNLAQIPYAMTTVNGQGAYQISILSRALFSNPADKRIPYTWITELQPSGPKISWITKYPGTVYADSRVSDNDIIIYRLSDIFLMKAEAYAGLSNIPLAKEYLNKVRRRADIGDYTASDVKAVVEKEILDERGRELYFENKRWYDLHRFHKGGTINVYTYVPNLIGKTTPLYWPLNTTVLANNPNIVQTEGY